MKIEITTDEISSFVDVLSSKEQELRRRIERFLVDEKHYQKQIDDLRDEKYSLEEEKASLNGRIDTLLKKLEKLERYAPALTKKEMEENY